MFSLLHNSQYWQNQKPLLGSTVDPGHPLAVGLVGCWDFLEGAGSRATDASRFGNHGKLKSGQIFGYGGIVGNGTSSYVDCGNPGNGSLDFSSDFTVSASFITQTLDTTRGVFSKGSPQNATGKGYQLAAGATGQLLIYFGDGVNGNKYANTSSSRYYAKVSIPSNISVVCKYDGSNWGGTQIYFNGQKATQSSTLNLVTGSVSDNSSSFLVGSRSSSFGWWNGVVYFVRIHNRALSAPEIAEITKAPYQFYRRQVRKTYSFPLLFSTAQIITAGTPLPFNIRTSAARSAFHTPLARSAFHIPSATSNFRIT